jgi:hypothetical protein
MDEGDDMTTDRPSPSAQARATTTPPRAGKPRSLTKGDWIVPIALVVLSLIPVIAGSVRLGELGGGAEVTPANARFFANPLPVVVHIVSSSVFCVVGAFQFSKGLRRRYRRWHRSVGRALVPLGLAAGASGLWLTLAYPFVEPDAWALYWIRLVVGSAMVASIGLAVLALLRRDYPSHGAWMIRGYAIGLGAGTQVLTFLVWSLIGGPNTEFGRVVVMGSGWVLNMIVAEWVIRRNPRAHGARGRASAGAHA